MRYSEAFKQQVVGEVATGKFKGPGEAARAYRIGNVATVARWLRQHGRVDLLPRVVRISSMEEQDERKVLKERVRQLERALADSHMKGLLDEAYLRIACGRLGVGPEEFKKKHVTKLSDPPRPAREG